MRNKRLPVGSNAPIISLPPLDLDPTENDLLHDSLWKRLKSAIEKQTNKAEKVIKKIVKNPSMDLGSLHDDTNTISKQRKFGQNARRLIKLVSMAFLNPVYIPWDVEEFHREHVKKGRDKRRINFPNPSLGSYSEPLTLVDAKGRIVLWYLPGLLCLEQQTGIRESTVPIETLLKNSVKEEKAKKKTPNWRTHKRNFVTKTKGNLCEPGSVTFSAGWFALGHETEEYELLPSFNIRMQQHLGSLEWIGRSNELERFLNLTLSLTNPDLFKSGLEILRKLRETENTKKVAKQWQSVYTGISVISNRTSPSHRDSKGRPEWFDTLMSYSDPSGRPRLLINDVGLDLEYGSGTVVSFCGSILEHEVKTWGDGDRVCIAHFMREAVRKRLDIPPAGWVERKIYLPECDVQEKENFNDDVEMDLLF